MIKSISARLAGWLGKQLAAKEEELEVYAYGLEIMLGGIFKIGLLLLIAGQLNILGTTILCTVGFVGIRFFGGGVHLCTYTRCLAGSISVLLVLGKIAAYKLSLSILWLCILITAILGVYSIIKWVPAGTRKKTVTDSGLRIKQKIKTFVLLTVYLVITLVFVLYQLVSLAFSLVFGVLAGLFLLTPSGYFFMQSLDNLLDLLDQKKMLIG
ncbi:MAG: accessory gene regulator ArgB-like protein [Peptococcaceae bacterium]